MSRIKLGRPSPAILVAAIALVAALGGSAVAEVATTTKLNKKETKEVGKIAKKKANKQIKKKAPGLDVNSAKSADTATTATSASKVSGRTPFFIKLSAGQTQTIATNGAVSLEANCLSSGLDRVRILAQTTQNGASMAGEDGTNAGQFNTGTASDSREVLVHSALVSVIPNGGNDDGGGYVIAPDGKTLAIDGEATALYKNYAGAKCLLAGVVTALG